RGRGGGRGRGCEAGQEGRRQEARRQVIRTEPVRNTSVANFSLEDVKSLRERLGTGMVDTKNALVEADGDIEKAVEILRLKGAKGNAKRADRSTSEGLRAVVESATAATMIELAC